MKVIVIGGGIGGLTLALSLHQTGIETEVFEAAPQIRPLGVGINLLPHAVRELTELGLQDRLAATGIPTGALIYTNKFGREIWREARGLAAGYRWPQFSIHRGRLQMLLLDAALERLGPERVHTGHALADFEDDGTGVTARFAPAADGRTPDPVRGDLLIAADGIHSTVRRRFYPDEGPPKWNGCVLWRAVTETDPYLDGRSMVMAGHQDQKFVCYPICRETADRGRSLVNWIAEIRYHDRSLWQREDWNRPGKIEEYLPAFESWDFGWLDVPDLIRRAAVSYEFPMVDRDPVERWTFGRVTLLGDAAHPMYPIGSNGSSQAILDARTLAGLLATEPQATDALESYDSLRRPATARIVEANRRNGPERVMQMVEERAPNGFAALDDVISRAELEATAREYKLIAGFDKDQLNDRPPLVPTVAAAPAA